MANKYREMLADRIESNCGYSSRWDHWAIEYTVGLYYADLDKDHIHELVCKEFGDEPMNVDLEWNTERVWSCAQEDMYHGLNDDCSNTTYSPANAVIYGLPYYQFPKKYKRRKPSDVCGYPAKQKDWWLDNPYTCLHFDVKFELQGRGGKHLVVSEFEGRKLNLSSDDLAEQIREVSDDNSYSNAWCQKLLVMMVEWDSTFSSRQASKEMEYQAANLMYSELLHLNKESAERQFWNERDVVTA